MIWFHGNFHGIYPQKQVENIFSTCFWGCVTSDWLVSSLRSHTKYWFNFLVHGRKLLVILMFNLILRMYILSITCFKPTLSHKILEKLYQVSKFYILCIIMNCLFLFTLLTCCYWFLDSCMYVRSSLTLIFHSSS